METSGGRTANPAIALERGPAGWGLALPGTLFVHFEFSITYVCFLLKKKKYNFKTCYGARGLTPWKGWRESGTQTLGGTADSRARPRREPRPPGWRWAAADPLCLRLSGTCLFRCFLESKPRVCGPPWRAVLWNSASPGILHTPGVPVCRLSLLPNCAPLCGSPWFPHRLSACGHWGVPTFRLVK